VLFMALIVALAMVGVGSALWFKVLNIDGVVQTGDVDAVLSFDGVRENDHGKDVGICDAGLNVDRDRLSVVIENGYPSYECFVFFNVENTGSIPIHVYHPTWTTLPPPEAVTFSLLDCYEEDTQLHRGDRPLVCTLYLHVEQEAEQSVRYLFEGFIDARQFNEPRDAIIDADGTASRFSGSGFAANIQVFPGAPLTGWPAGGNEGIDLFDTDGSTSWTFGDDLHVEDPATHTGAIRNGVHDDFLDPLVLDWDNSLDATPGSEAVNCDLEGGVFCTGTLLTDLSFYDANGDGSWNDGEDIVLDTNGNGVFDA
jgi:hypothetical protein